MVVRRICASAFSACMAIAISASPAPAYTTEECNQISSDSATIMRNFHAAVLDRRPVRTGDELRPQLRSRHMREDDGVYWFVVEAVTGDHLEEFRRMSERDRENNRAYIAVQIRLRCLNGTIARYASSR